MENSESEYGELTERTDYKWREKLIQSLWKSIRNQRQSLILLSGISWGHNRYQESRKNSGQDPKDGEVWRGTEKCLKGHNQTWIPKWERINFRIIIEI